MKIEYDDESCPEGAMNTSLIIFEEENCCTRLRLSRVTLDEGAISNRDKASIEAAKYHYLYFAQQPLIILEDENCCRCCRIYTRIDIEQYECLQH